jgi:hypothetical protein
MAKKNPNGTRRTATTKETVAIVKKLEQVCRKTTEGHCEYVDRHIDDASIAAEIGCPEAAVARYRKAVYGMFRTSSGGRQRSGARLDAHEARIVALEHAAEETRKLMRKVLADPFVGGQQTMLRLDDREH